MAETILGLPTSAKFQAEGDRFNDYRRRILHIAPQGGAPLTGLLSMIKSEPTNDSIFLWQEKRYLPLRAALYGTNPATSTAPTDGDTDDGTAIATGSKAVTTDTYFKVATTKDLKVGHIIRNSVTGVLYQILAITRGVANPVLLGYIKVRPIRAYSVGTVATDFAAATILDVVGSAYGEGQSGAGLGSTGFKRPFTIQNTTQIFRDHKDFPGSVLQMGTKWDATGIYKEAMRDLMIDHMVGIEKSILFGKRSTVTRASLDATQEDLSVRTMSGIIEFLEMWDAGATGITVDGSTYAPYSFKTASTLDTDDNKRIIANAGGTISVTAFNTWAERVCRYHTNKTNEKLILLGSGALMAVCDMFRKNSTYNVTYQDKAYGLEITQVKTPFSTFNLVTHPLFNADPTMRYWMLFLDIWSLKLRPLGNRDTQLIPNRQNNGDDFRRDEFLTELGLEMWNPEAAMLVKNVQAYLE